MRFERDLGVHELVFRNLEVFILTYHSVALVTHDGYAVICRPLGNLSIVERALNGLSVLGEIGLKVALKDVLHQLLGAHLRRGLDLRDLHIQVLVGRTPVSSLLLPH